MASRSLWPARWLPGPCSLRGAYLRCLACRAWSTRAGRPLPASRSSCDLCPPATKWAFTTWACPAPCRRRWRRSGPMRTGRFVCLRRRRGSTGWNSSSGPAAQAPRRLSFCPLMPLTTPVVLGAVELPALHWLTVQVRDSDGAPVPGALVLAEALSVMDSPGGDAAPILAQPGWFEPCSPWAIRGSATTDDDGAARFLVPASGAEVTVVAPGHAPAGRLAAPGRARFPAGAGSGAEGPRSRPGRRPGPRRPCPDGCIPGSAAGADRRTRRGADPPARVAGAGGAGRSARGDSEVRCRRRRLRPGAAAVCRCPVWR